MPERTRILVVDDEEIVRNSCRRIFARAGYQVVVVKDGQEALDILTRDSFDIVLSDLKMPGIDGMTLLAKIQAGYPHIDVIIFTGYSSVGSAVEAMKLGAADYIAKPFQPDELLSRIEKLMKKRRMRAERLGLVHDQSSQPIDLDNIIGRSPAMQEIFMLVRKVAPTNSTVLIMGESGTGKELIARALHRYSKRQQHRFEAVDCGTLTKDLLESELFGHVKGAFTGAVAAKKGIFELADRGTLFLDEIGDTTLEVQSKLLRALQEREFRQVGGTELRGINVRFIFATNKDLEAMVRNGEFREDLFYRIYVFPIVLPPLRERKEDIPLLVRYFLDRMAQESGRPRPGISDEALNRLNNYEWPGNVRQLENALYRMFLIADTESLTVRHLPPELRGWSGGRGRTVPRTSEELKAEKKELKEQSVREVERLFVVHALERNKWNVTRAAEEVGMQRTNFHALMRKHDISLS